MALTDNLSLCLEFESGALTTDATGTLTAFTNVNTATSVAGKVGNAGSFASASSQYLTHANDAAIQAADINFSIACWVKLTTKSASQEFITHWNAATTQRSYLIYYDSGDDRFEFGVSPNGSSAVLVLANTFGSPSTGVWYYLVGVHNATSNTIKISVNGGTQDSTAHSTGILTGTATFSIGSINIDTAPVNFMNGQIDQALVYKRDITSDIATLYNSSNGLSYAQMAPATYVPIGPPRIQIAA